MSVFKTVEKEAINLKIGLSGPSGSGKTFSSLLLAKGLVGDLSKVAIVDTENKSSKLYSHLGPFKWVDFKPPYDPRRFSKIIGLAVEDPEIECLILDSITPEWDGEGGCLDIHQSYGGKFQDWAKVTPLHKNFIDSIVQSDIHIICTMRRKQDYAMVEKNGRMQVEKMGLKEIQREGFEYELSVNLSLEMNHLAQTSKDRTGLFADSTPFLIDEKVGEKLRMWNNGELN